MTLNEIFLYNFNNKSDINEHLLTLKKYATITNHITEFGVREGISTSALLAGIPKKLISYSLGWNKEKIEQLKNLTIDYIDFTFTEANVLNIEIELTEFLFIDTFHTYVQLKKELELHSNKVQKFIAMHDTEIFGQTGQDGSTPGLLAAISEFIANQAKKWKLRELHNYNNGLIVLERIGI